MIRIKSLVQIKPAQQKLKMIMAKLKLKNIEKIKFLRKDKAGLNNTIAKKF